MKSIFFFRRQHPISVISLINYLSLPLQTYALISTFRKKISSLWLNGPSWYSPLDSIFLLFFPSPTLLPSPFTMRRCSICFHQQAGQINLYLDQWHLQGPEENSGVCVCVSVSKITVGIIWKKCMWESWKKWKMPKNRKYDVSRHCTGLHCLCWLLEWIKQL